VGWLEFHSTEVWRDKKSWCEQRLEGMEGEGALKSSTVKGFCGEERGGVETFWGGNN